MIEDTEMSNALLPIGFCDLLPSDAQAQASLVQWIMSAFNDYGYERISPPLLEFEQSLLANAGSGIAEQTFRVMDPETHYMMGIRPDITPQIARIAATRLINSPRPLRLSYAGPCILVSGVKHNAARQILQAGIELIGIDSPQADAEIIIITAAALGMENILPAISIDLMMPQLANSIIQTANFNEQQTNALMRALDRKDIAAVQKHGGNLSDILSTMLQAAGPADRAIKILKTLNLPPEAQQIFNRLLTVVETVKTHSPDLQLTIDPVEFRGWNYHTGLCFSVYINGVSGEIGRGGRYLSDNAEPACGLTLRPDLLWPLINFDAHIRQRVFVPFGHTIQELNSLREEGYILIMGLTVEEDPLTEARRLNCNYIMQGKELQPIAE